MRAHPSGPRPPWDGSRVVLGITGGIAAYKSVQVARDLTLLGAEVDVVPTQAATRFVPPLTFEAVTGRAVHTELLSSDGVASHIGLARDADLVVVAPATADFLARAAHGRADDLLTTVLLATRAPVLLAPAMNDRMYAHPQTLRNLEHLRTVCGYGVVGPAEGRLAAGEGSGPGRMLEPEILVEHTGRLLGRDPAFESRRVVVTAGPTHEPIDPVRFVGNRSSGRMGFALAREAWLRGADVVLVTGPSPLDDPVGVDIRRVGTAREMLEVTRQVVESADIVVYSAAVSDFAPSEVHSEKMKKGDVEGALSVELSLNPDIARETRELRSAGTVAVGFALETQDLADEARRKMEEKGFDLVIANDPSQEGAGFEVATNRVTIFGRDGGEEELPLQGKDDVARVILDRARALLSASEGGA